MTSTTELLDDQTIKKMAVPMDVAIEARIYLTDTSMAFIFSVSSSRSQIGLNDRVRDTWAITYSSASPEILKSCLTRSRCHRKWKSDGDLSHNCHPRNILPSHPDRTIYPCDRHAQVLRSILAILDGPASANSANPPCSPLFRPL